MLSDPLLNRIFPVPDMMIHLFIDLACQVHIDSSPLTEPANSLPEPHQSRPAG